MEEDTQMGFGFVMVGFLGLFCDNLQSDVKAI